MRERASRSVGDVSGVGSDDGEVEGERERTVDVSGEKDQGRRWRGVDIREKETRANGERGEGGTAFPVGASQT